ncbi:MAG: hypothetical protein J6S10_04635 [Clostridia bacterium]|nr:hypothetical protein [Clostridia bacterium]MBO7250564.1 hypothetical protein [Clostridia bacterium]
MILDPKQTTVAYRCPHCGAGVMSLVGLFTLSADMIKLKCTCGESEMNIVYSKDGKVRLTVPCILCPTPHTFTINSSVFFKNELFALPCPYSDINICVTGEENNVKAELARTELELLDLLEENGLENFDAFHGEQTLTDPQILDIIMFVLNDLDSEGKIYCKCEPHEYDADSEERYEAEVLHEGIKVTCKKCGASKLIPSNSLINAHEFLNAESLTLE